MSVILVIMFTGCQSNSVNITNGKPDLIIDKVTYSQLPGCFEGSPSGIICGGPTFEFTLKIKNVGTAKVSSPFFILNSRSKQDFNNLYCSYGQLTNDPPLSIPASGSIDIKIQSDIDDSVPKVLFILDTNDTSKSIPKIDESNYNNNSYTLSLNW